jgi:hypothetical protein
MTSMVLAEDQDYSVAQRFSRTANTVEEARAAMAALDEDQILESCRGAVIREWQYSFRVGGQEISGISVTGAMELARIRAEAGRPIRWTNVLADPCEQNGRKGLRVTVHARDQRSGAETVAMVFEPWEDEKGRPIPFVERRALSKCKRNCVLDLIPETQILELLKAAKDFAAGKVPRKPQMRQPATQPAETPATAVPVTSGYAGEAEDATPEQMTELVHLVQDERIPAEKRSAIQGKLEAGGYATKAAAQRVIDQVKQYLTSRPA